ncbi:MAG: AbiJ-NTD4 domain-containing protein [Pseudolactococcus laudensis]
MELYSERNGKRDLKQHTYCINENMYSLLLNCCTKYKKNLTKIFQLPCHNPFVDEDYIKFNEKIFSQRINSKIPSLFRNKSGAIAAPKSGDHYDQYALLDLIEFFGKNIKDVREGWNHNIYIYDSSEVFNEFKNSINELFSEAGLMYELNDEKIIERLVDDDVLTPEIETSFESLTDKQLHDLLESAIDFYRTPNNSARQESLEKLWDALERLKSYYKSLDKKESVHKILKNMAPEDGDFCKMFDDEFKLLTDIGNHYNIRHHETNQKDLPDKNYYDYLFNRCLSLIALSVKYLLK